MDRMSGYGPDDQGSSLCTCTFCSRRITVSSQDFHSCNSGSIPGENTLKVLYFASIYI